LAECERRDRKGLYAKARRGEIPEFTGISSPYEEPQDADVRVDTTGRSIDDALGDVLDALAEEGYLDLRGGSVASRLAPGAPQPTDVARPTPVEVRGAPATSLETPAADASGPLMFLFVCTANICRSPYMELAARARADAAGADLVFTSAGTHGRVDHPMNPPMAAALARHTPASAADVAADVARFRSRLLTRAMVEEADLVVTAEASHRAFVLDEVPGAFRRTFTLGQLAEALKGLPDDLDRAALLAALGERRGTAATSLDVGDPYGRGDAAAETCAAHVDTLLDAVVARLAAARQDDPDSERV
jgi:sulfate adenylyltransferase